MAFPGQCWLPLWNRKAKAISNLSSVHVEYPAIVANFHEAKHKMVLSSDGQGRIYIRQSDL